MNESAEFKQLIAELEAAKKLPLAVPEVTLPTLVPLPPVKEKTTDIETPAPPSQP
jgi:hypothetical protein